jgi:hypothetical protein
MSRKYNLLGVWRSTRLSLNTYTSLGVIAFLRACNKMRKSQF